MAKATSQEPADDQVDDQVVDQADVDDGEPASADSSAVTSAEPTDVVSYRVTKVGAGKVFTGRHTAEGAETHPKNAIVHGVPRAIAEELEDRNFIEILEDGEA